MDAKTSGIMLLGSAVVGMQNGDGKGDIYTVPEGHKDAVTHIKVRNPTASLAGGTDFDFGDGANADTWKNTVDLSGMTATTDYYFVEGNNAKYTEFDAGDVFGVKPVTGATADADATIEVFGHRRELA